MIRMQACSNEIVSTGNFKATANENIFVTPDGDIAVIGPHQAMLVQPDFNNQIFLKEDGVSN